MGDCVGVFGVNVYGLFRLGKMDKFEYVLPLRREGTKKGGE